MRDRSPFLGGVVDLPRLKSRDERRAVWRQMLATLAQPSDGPGPLEALHPDAIQAAVKTALTDGLLDDTDWLAESAAGAALYELAAAVPPSNEQRELGRRVAARLLQGSAETFTAIATRMALGTGKGLAAAHVRARVALVTELPLSLAVADGPMCLALVSRRQLARDFIVQPSMASLPARRSASRIIERAAREAATRAQQGDDHAMRAFSSEGVAQAFERLLADREPLVWRHAATARGLLVPWNPQLGKTVRDGLDPKLTPTEWRRAATSIAAMISVDPEGAQKLVKQWMADGPLAKDIGSAAAFVWGLARAAEAEPQVAGDLLAQLTERTPHIIAEAAIDVCTDLGNAGPFERSIGKIVQALRNHQSTDDGEAAAIRETVRDLERVPRTRTSKSDAEAREDDPLGVQVTHALAAFATEGARAAYGKAQGALETMHGLIDALEAVTDEVQGAVARRTSLTVLHQLDQSLLERSTLDDLLRLAASPEATKAHEAATTAARDRIASWVLDRFREREAEDKKDAPVKDAVLRLRRLRAMLHLVDSDLEGDDPTRAQNVRKRWSLIAAVLLNRMATGLPPILRRANAATLSRTLDALVRAEALDPADALLAVARRVAEAGDFRVLSEASMDPSLRHAFARWADLAAATDDKALDALDAWTRDGLLDPSSRAEALRTMIVRLQTSTSAIMRAASLAELTDVAPVFETAVSSIAQLCASARARLEADGKSVPSPALFDLAVAVSRVLSGAEDEVSKAAADEARTVAKTLPAAIARVALRGIDALAALPREASKKAEPSEVLRARMTEALPAWLPARRTLGGFYILRPLASGAVGSVMVAVRIEDKGEDGAERFALKVPAYDASAARTVSEAEFFQMFRDEASALLAIPSHPNLARFVTFDTGSRPKPILVMELVEGENLEHAITSRAIDTTRAFKLLDDVLAGLEAMHSVDVGHLDLKPSNVVLRQNKDAVLVDFGLAGRRVRPGCATGPYGAPEVWAGDSSSNASPRSADVYAFGCVAFEALTGDTLFQADNELQQITMHLAHDGFPDKLRKLASNPQFQPFAEVLFSALRRDPHKRPSVPQLRAELRRLAPTLANAKWPLSHA
jgi:hypothetical protein